jgi:Fic family protein
MPIVHYQFESIHPFYDGNGRTGRVLNVLYLVLAKKLDFPILFLSEYINNNRKQYYELLSKTTAT